MTGFNFGAMLSQNNQIKQIPLDMLVPFHNHQFSLYDGERRDDMVESIRKNGVMTPIVCRPNPDGTDTYEILIGHNRWNCSKIAGLETIPAIIKEQLTEEEAQYLYDTADLMMEYPTIPCNDCKYCMPCPYGIDIPAILIHYNKCVNEGNVPESSQDENYRKARRAFLVGYDRSVPKLRQADHCTGCNQCSPHCPQTIDIPKELHRIDAYVEQLKQETL